MQITNHAKERYVERVKDIRDKNEMRQYLAQNEDRVTEHIARLYEHSKKVFTGQIGGDKTTRDYYLNGDTCLVVKADDCICTIYKINFAFPEETRLKVIEDLKDAIQDYSKITQIEKQEANEKKSSLDNEIDKLQLEIKHLQDEIEIKKDSIKLYQDEKNLITKKLRSNQNLLQVYAEQLLGNTEHKKDIKAI